MPRGLVDVSVDIAEAAPLEDTKHCQHQISLKQDTYRSADLLLVMASDAMLELSQ